MEKIPSEKRIYDKLTYNEEYIMNCDKDEYNYICEIPKKKMKSYENDKILKKNDLFFISYVLST